MELIWMAVLIYRFYISLSNTPFLEFLSPSTLRITGSQRSNLPALIRTAAMMLASMPQSQTRLPCASDNSVGQTMPVAYMGDLVWADMEMTEAVGLIQENEVSINSKL